ncbi:hypothetical protein N4G70_35110, partial [Streptomyces sp. ASQP_92]|uniref:hypothetical protein n=1 Tax=Streptomyces sp. ASQP_92 TaxID=2979116 RepID=UPI0037D998EC|nr:hypothetical protein [Streptomyces sp. ASQP_92]
ERSGVNVTLERAETTNRRSVKYMGAASSSADAVDLALAIVLKEVDTLPLTSIGAASAAVNAVLSPRRPEGATTPTDPSRSHPCTVGRSDAASPQKWPRCDLPCLPTTAPALTFGRRDRHIAVFAHLTDVQPRFKGGRPEDTPRLDASEGFLQFVAHPASAIDECAGLLQICQTDIAHV